MFDFIAYIQPQIIFYLFILSKSLLLLPLRFFLSLSRKVLMQCFPLFVVQFVLDVAILISDVTGRSMT